MDLHRRRWTRTRGPLHRGSALFTAGALVASLLLSSVFAGTALAADSGYQVPGASTTPSDWTDPNNAFASDNAYATATADNKEQGYRDFGFIVPAGSIIDGITVQLEAKQSGTGTWRLQVALSGDDGDSYTGWENTSNLTSSDSVLTEGSVSDTWGETWDPTQLTNGNFRLKVRTDHRSGSSAGTISLDQAQVKVTYRTIDSGTANADLSSEVCQAADFSFVVDMSGSIGVQGSAPSNLPDMQSGIAGFVGAFQGNGGDGRYAGIQFNNTSASNPTNGFVSDSTFTSWVSALSGPTGSTPTAAGIDSGRGNTAGDRSGVPNIMFVVTDGSPNVPGGSMSSPSTWLTGADAAIAAANTTRGTGIPGGGKWVVNAVYLSTAGDPGDTNLPFSPAGDAQWASAVMTQIGGGSYLPGDFKSFANDLLNSIGCKPGLNLVKSADKTELPLGGGVVNYTYTLTNTGNQALSEIALKDEITGTSTAACGPITGPTGDTNNDTKLDQTETWVYACSATITKDTANTATADSKETAPATATWSVTVAKPAHLTLVKIVENKGGGSATTGDWTLTATGPTLLSGAGGATGEVSAGTYALSESTGPANYGPSSWSCDGGSQVGASVSLEADESATCTITNTYNPPSPRYGTIIIEKQTTPGGSSQEFTFSSALSDGTFTLSDGETETFYELTPGTYGVEEINLPDGWTLASVTGDEGCQLGQPEVVDTAFVADLPQGGNLVSIYVGAGETVRCVFNNRGPEASPTPPPPVQIPYIHVEKSASASTVVAGTAVTYTYTVTNTSIDALLKNITVSDDKCSPAAYVSGDDGDTFLQIGETWTYTCTTELSATTTNTVTSTGTWGSQTVSDTAQATVTVTKPEGGVEAATATPRVTPPPTATAGSDNTGNPGSNLGLALAALALFGLVLGILAPKPARARGRNR
jgi:hypothetical protein